MNAFFGILLSHMNSTNQVRAVHFLLNYNHPDAHYVYLYNPEGSILISDTQQGTRYTYSEKKERKKDSR